MARKKPQNNAQGSSPAAVKAMTSQPPQINIGNLATYRPWEVMGPVQPYVEPTKAGPFVGPVTPAGPSVAELAERDYWNNKSAAEAKAKEDALNQNLAAAKAFFNTYGMNELWAGAENLIRQGYTDNDTINVMLSQDANYQAAYYKRFPGVNKIREANKARIANGLPPIPEPSPATYVGLEQGYRTALKNLAGDWGTPDDMANWMAKEVSAQEVADRVTSANNYILYNANEDVKNELREIYGLNDREMALYVLDPDRALTFLQKEYEVNRSRANVGGAARSAGLDLNDGLRNSIAGNESYSNSYGNSLAGFQNVADEESSWKKLSAMSGITTTTEELVTDQFGLEGAAEVSGKKKKLASQERARFGGSSATNSNSLSAGRIAQ